jgi:DUF971 family protein
MRTPTEIKRLDFKGLQITWSDGLVQEIGSEKLRRSCPCATCLETRGDTSHSAPLTEKKPGRKSLLRVVSSSKQEETRLERIWPIGNYALGMEWGDGHHTGVYSFDLLYQLGAQ